MTSPSPRGFPYNTYHQQPRHESTTFVALRHQQSSSPTATVVAVEGTAASGGPHEDSSGGRRGSFYDNSLPRDSPLYEYYQQQNELLPGTRNLNQYFS